MNKLVGIAVSLSLATAAHAATEEDFLSAATKMAVYDTQCRPLSANVHDMIFSMLAALDEKKVKVATARLLINVQIAGEQTFCNILRPQVEQLERGK